MRRPPTLLEIQARAEKERRRRNAPRFWQYVCNLYEVGTVIHSTDAQGIQPPVLSFTDAETRHYESRLRDRRWKDAETMQAEMYEALSPIAILSHEMCLDDL